MLVTRSVVSPKAVLGGIAAVLLILSAAPRARAVEPAGSLLEVRPDGSLSPEELARTVAPLFKGFDDPLPRYTVDAYLIRYTSRYPDGGEAVIVAQLFVPRLPAGRPGLLYVFAPGSTGLLDVCRPSREHIAGIRWGLYRSHVLAFAGRGVIGLLPDYMGFGDPQRLQPYFSAVAEGRMMLDGVRAVNAFLADRFTAGARRPAAFFAGYSQGGHAAFAAADLRAAYAPELRIHGIIGYGPTTNLEALFLEFTVAAPLVVYSYSRIYGSERFNPQDILAERWAATLEHDVTRQCIGGIQSYYPMSPERLFTPRFVGALRAGTLAQEFPGIYAILEENSSGLSGHGLPALILQGGHDIVVHPPSQDAFVRALCRAGSPVTYLRYPQSRHDTRQIAFEEVLSWMERLAAGAEPSSNCAENR